MSSDGDGDDDARRLFSLKEVSEHNKTSSCWLSIDGSVYDVTSFLSSHPGGERTILSAVSRSPDVTRAFRAVGHSARASEILSTYKIGSTIDHDHHHHQQHHDRHDDSDHTTTTTKDGNPWLADGAGSRGVGESGRRFGPANFSWNATMCYAAPFVLRPQKRSTASVRGYWTPVLIAEQSTLFLRRSRFFSCYWIPVWLVAHRVAASFLPIAEDILGWLLLLHVVPILMCLVAVVVEGEGRRAVRLATSFRVVALAACFALFLSALTYLATVPALESTDARLVLSCVVCSHLLLAVPSSEESSEESDVPRGLCAGSWLFGRIPLDERLPTAFALATPSIAVIAANAYLGSDTMISCVGRVAAAALFGHGVASFARYASRVPESRGGKLAPVAASALVLSGVSILLCRWLLSSLSAASPVSFDASSRTSLGTSSSPVFLLAALAFVILMSRFVLKLMKSALAVAAVDTPTASCHLQFFPSVYVLHVVALIQHALLFLFGYGFTNLPLLSCLVLSFVNHQKYMRRLTDGSVANFDRDPVGSCCEDMCRDVDTGEMPDGMAGWFSKVEERSDAESPHTSRRVVLDPSSPLTLRVLHGEMGLSSSFVILNQYVSFSLLMIPANFLKNVASLLLYGDLSFYMHPRPVLTFDPNTGSRVDVGIAYCVTPRDTQPKPGCFVCNVGHMDKPSTGDQSDWLMSNMHTYRMVKHLAEHPRSGERGFVSNVICEFWKGDQPSGRRRRDVDDRHQIRQVNLSVWSSGKAAHDWYVANRAHAETVRMLKRGEKGHGTLSTFSSMLAHLSPTSGFPVRWYVKCRACGNLQTRFPDETKCSRCGEEVGMEYM